MDSRPPFTREQITNKVLITIQLIGVFEITTMEWNGFDEVNKNWYWLKSHFTDAYDIWLGVGAWTAGMTGCHGVANVVDNDSLGSITNSIAQIQMANKANVQVLNENISTIDAETCNHCSTIMTA